MDVHSTPLQTMQFEGKKIVLHILHALNLIAPLKELLCSGWMANEGGRY
jgi:hypothetical protein